MTKFLFLGKYLKALNSDRVTFLDELRSLGKLSCGDKTVSNNLVFITEKSSLHKISCLTSQKNNSKDSKNSEYSIDLGFTEKSRR